MKLAVIPARGGSKRIPHKNIRPFCGRPIITYSIDTALRSGCFDRVVVSTDDSDIAEVAQRCGAEVPFIRPAELADDFSGTNAVVRHAIEWFMAQGEVVTYACCIYATAPFLEPDTVRQGFDSLSERGVAFAVTVTSFPFPIQRAVRINNAGRLEMFWPEHQTTRSQDLEEAFHDAGQMYWGRADAFLSNKPMFAPHTVPVRVPRERAQDIDTLEDWSRAELMYQALMRRHARSEL